MHLAAGLSVGLAGLAAGYTIGMVGDAVSSSMIPGGGSVLTGSSGRAIIHAAAESVRGYGFDTDIWRGSWSLWVRPFLHLYWFIEEE